MSRNGSPNPAGSAFDAALTRLGATVLHGDAEQVTLACDELELVTAWEELQALLADREPAEWAGLVADYLTEAIAAARAEDADWDQLRPRVFPVLLNHDAAHGLAERQADVLAFPYAGGLAVTVAYRVASALCYVTGQQCADWAVDAEMILSSALDNLREATPEDAVQTVEPDHFALDGGDGFDSSRLLICDELLPGAAETGVVAAAPARDMLSFAPFNSRGVRHLKALVNVAAQGYRSWPFPLVESLFYLAPGSVVHIAVSRDADGTPRLRIPEELALVQARLVGEGRW